MGKTTAALEEAERVMLAMMSPAERETYQRGCAIVDRYVAMTANSKLPAPVRVEARAILAAMVAKAGANLN